jgi:hypothetical protein
LPEYKNRTGRSDAWKTIAKECENKLSIVILEQKKRGATNNG